MLGIKKGSEPPEMRLYRETTPQATYGGMPKPAVRQALHRDQGGLCAYCMRRIYDNPPSGTQIRLTIEHWSPQSTDDTRTLHWPDLMAVCDGKIDGTQICDKARGAKPLDVHPVRDAASMESRCRYFGDGRIQIDSKLDDISTLNLNNKSLCNSRTEIIKILLQRIGGADQSALRAELARWEARDGAGLRREYAGVACYLLRKAIKQAEGRARRTKGIPR